MLWISAIFAGILSRLFANTTEKERSRRNDLSCVRLAFPIIFHKKKGVCVYLEKVCQAAKIYQTDVFVLCLLSEPNTSQILIAEDIWGRGCVYHSLSTEEIFIIIFRCRHKPSVIINTPTGIYSNKSHTNTHAAVREAHVVSFNELSGSPSLQGVRKSSAEFSPSLSASETSVSHTASHLNLLPRTSSDSWLPLARSLSHLPTLFFPSSLKTWQTLAVSLCCSLSHPPLHLLHFLLFLPLFYFAPLPPSLRYTSFSVPRSLLLIIRAWQKEAGLKCHTWLLHFILHIPAGMSR